MCFLSILRKGQVDFCGCFDLLLFEACRAKALCLAVPHPLTILWRFNRFVSIGMLQTQSKIDESQLLSF